MLVLSRKRGETVHIGRDITVTFLEIRGRAIRIGIDAPSSVCILRGELCSRTGLVAPIDDRTRGDPIALAVDC